MSKRLRILHEEGYQWTDTTAYIRSLFTNVPNIPFNESEPYSKASSYIDNCVKFMIEKASKRSKGFFLR
jgi:hypothetical protein